MMTEKLPIEPEPGYAGGGKSLIRPLLILVLFSDPDSICT